jgi:hypothetical protein
MEKQSLPRYYAGVNKQLGPDHYEYENYEFDYG